MLADADLDKTVKWAIWAKMNNTGQCCVAAKRFIIVEELHESFLERFQTALAAFQPGDPMDQATTLAPLSTESALVQLLAQVKRAVANGAIVVLGGKRIDRPGSFMQPTILTNIKRANPAFREEFFGPVALFFRVKSEDEAVALQTIPISAWAVPSSLKMWRAANAWRAALIPAWCSSITRRGRQRTCRSAASGTPAMDASFAVWAFRSS